MDELVISGKRYISSRKAGKEYNYHSDYIGQMIRAGKLQGQKVGRTWYVSASSLAAHMRKEVARDLVKEEKKASHTKKVAHKIPESNVAEEKEIISSKNTEEESVEIRVQEISVSDEREGVEQKNTAIKIIVPVGEAEKPQPPFQREKVVTYTSNKGRPMLTYLFDTTEPEENNSEPLALPNFLEKTDFFSDQKIISEAVSEAIPIHVRSPSASPPSEIEAAMSASSPIAKKAKGRKKIHLGRLLVLGATVFFLSLGVSVLVSQTQRAVFGQNSAQ